jgi:hypothetical protein
MILSFFALVAAVGGGQSDTSRASRDAFTSCLRAYVERGIENRIAADAFAAEYPRQCAAQESAYRDSFIRGFRGRRADAEELAGLEVEDARLNFASLFELEAEETDRRQREVDAQAAAQAPQPAPQPAEASQQPAADPPPSL